MSSFSLLIVVPTFNSFHLLTRLLHSLQQQSWPHRQLLFIDGPSDADHRYWLDQCCAAESRCRWLKQDPAEPGIFGAMNKGFTEAGPNDWMLFWGSDDWAATPTVLDRLADFLERAESQGNDSHSLDVPDLLVCCGRYADAGNGELTRRAVFQPFGLLNSAAYRRLLLLGATPPHQATLFGPGARRRLARYDPGFRLSADLDYFLQLSFSADLVVQCLDLELVHMLPVASVADATPPPGGAPRLPCAFGALVVPFLCYVRRVASLLERIS